MQALVDKSAIGLSLLCALHCLLFPLAIFLYPNFIYFLPNDETVHLLIVFIVIPISVFALLKGAKLHKKPSIFFIGISGLLTLVVALLLGHDVIGSLGEKIVTLIGSLLVIIAHIQNYSTCLRTNFDCHSDSNNLAN